MFKKLCNYKTEWLSSIGFDNLNDFFNSIMGIKNTTIPLIAGGLTTVLSLFSHYVGEYIYTPAWGIFILFILTGADIITGLSNSINKKEGVKPNRLGRASVRFVMQVFIVFIFTQIHEIWDFIVKKWMIDIVLFTFVISVFWSVIRNAYELGWVKEENYRILENALDINRLLGLFEKIGGWLKGKDRE